MVHGKVGLGHLMTLMSGGAMGAFIEYYFSNVQTIVSYSVITTSLGAGGSKPKRAARSQVDYGEH